MSVSGELKLPLLNTAVRTPTRGTLAWYLGLGAMTALEVIEWPVALVVGAGHMLATHSRSQTARELGEGVESGG